MTVHLDTWIGDDYPDVVAHRAAGFVVSNAPERDRFLARSGLSHADLGRRPLERRHMTSVLDFLIEDEAALTKFARTTDIPVEVAYEARRIYGRQSQGGR
jgi:hypothetical protein